MRPGESDSIGLREKHSYWWKKHQKAKGATQRHIPGTVKPLKRIH